MTATQQPQEITLSAVVTRADGSTEELGVVSYWHEDPAKRAQAYKDGKGVIAFPSEQPQS